MDNFIVLCVTPGHNHLQIQQALSEINTPFLFLILAHLWPISAKQQSLSMFAELDFLVFWNVAAHPAEVP